MLQVLCLSTDKTYIYGTVSVLSSGNMESGVVGALHLEQYPKLYRSIWTSTRAKIDPARTRPLLNLEYPRLSPYISVRDILAFPGTSLQ